MLKTKNQQLGFTLIELVMVIVILGILAATALPKFADLSGNAKYATFNASFSAMKSAATIVHSQAVVNGVEDGVVTIDGVDITVAKGYPIAADMLVAAGVDSAIFTNFSVAGPSGRNLTMIVGDCLAQYTDASTTNNIVFSDIISLTTFGATDTC